MVEKIATTINNDQLNFKCRQEELDAKLVEYTNNDKNFILASSYLLELASKAKGVFESSQPAKKNKILKMLLANCKINQKRLQLTLLKALDKLLAVSKSQNWLRIQVTDF